MIFLFYFKIQTCGNTLPDWSTRLTAFHCKIFLFTDATFFMVKKRIIYRRNVTLRTWKFQRSNRRSGARRLSRDYFCRTIIIRFYSTLTTLAPDFTLTHRNKARGVKCSSALHSKLRRQTHAETIAPASLRTCKHNRAIIPDKMWEGG